MQLRHTERVKEKMATTKASRQASRAKHSTDANDDVFNADKLDEDDFLMFVVGGVNFLWAAPTTTKAEPELLLRDFLSVSGLKIGRVRVDGAFDASSGFKSFCKRRNIEICASVAYTHTMQARVEGAIRVCKEHVRCMLKSSNCPTRFWPYALLHFCRTFNWWPSQNGPPPWTKMQQSKFCFDMDRDLHTWGAHMVAHLPREHPLVQEEQTHGDRALEGIFLGNDPVTPTYWMYSFRLERVLRVQDVTIYDGDYPFRRGSLQERSLQHREREL
mmetsp:Transcript_68447/g.142724  ORF Transcript_68447/g.142724 Transcript_68447/m.142724 type:complete len:273 (+) Transcript_68447:444-1262(+)